MSRAYRLRQPGTGAQLPRHLGQMLRRGVLHAVLLLGGLLFLLPFIWMVSTSLKFNDQLMTTTPQLFFWPLDWANYPYALLFGNLLGYVKNSVILVVINLMGTLLSCSLAAYAFARLRWPGRNFFFLVLLATLMVPAEVTMVPRFLIFHALGWVNTFLPLTVPAFLGAPFFIFLLRQFFASLPRELEDAARIDGASFAGVYRHIALPLSRPALAAVAIFNFQGVWNDFINPLIYLNSNSLKPLSLGLYVFLQENASYWNLLMAASTLMTIPVIAVFFFTQRYFIQGITLTGLKG
ncbi:MAG: carbohydrate ABC transporter permease [Chloroflexi bacterium]|nr:carbohydrate ABC transporter permease [Chloroflexota bacterium]